MIRKDGTSQRRGAAYYRENVARIRKHGIGVVGSFILGIDTQDMSTIVPEILAFAAETELDGLNPTILTPLPGTRDFKRFEAEGRILFNDYPRDWERYTRQMVHFHLKNAESWGNEKTGADLAAQVDPAFVLKERFTDVGAAQPA